MACGVCRKVGHNCRTCKGRTQQRPQPKPQRRQAAAPIKPPIRAKANVSVQLVPTLPTANRATIQGDILSFNCGHKKYAHPCADAAALLRNSRPSIVALTELPSIAWLMELLQRVPEYELIEKGTWRSNDRYAVLGRRGEWQRNGEVAHSDYYKYASIPLRHARSRALVQFVIVHLQYKAAVMTRIRALQSIMTDEDVNTAAGWVIAGDFNLSPRDIEAACPELTARLAISSGLPVHTTRRGNSFDNVVLSAKIAGRMKLGATRVLANEIVEEGSDHFPVLVSFTIAA